MVSLGMINFEKTFRTFSHGQLARTAIDNIHKRLFLYVNQEKH